MPAAGENRINGMIESRPDWVISRQRAWGVPIAVFVREAGDGSAEILQDDAINKRIADAFEQEGADAWYAPGARERFLGSRANEDWKKVDDILDVWFDSGSTHAFVLEDPKHFPSLAGIKRKADGGSDAVMYLEGSDQHRGWFHSSLLESCGTRGRAPFDVVLTHGFVLDEAGRKMSKSLKNVTAPQEVITQSGADILRMWVCASDYADDLRIGPEILKTTVETYRKLRNTVRWMLGSLAHFHPDDDRIAPEKMPELERLMLHRLAELDELVRKAYADFDYKRIFAALAHFMTTDLSAFYFDVRKDALYCDPISSLTRKSALTVIDHLFRCTVTWLAPMLCFTAEEAWCERHRSADASVHLELFPDVPKSWRDDKLAEKWRKVRLVRRAVTGALEIARAGKRIGSSLEADPIVHVTNPELFEAVVDIDLAEVCITSAATLANGEARPTPSACRRSPAWPSWSISPKAANARARGKFPTTSAPTRNIPTSRRATPRRSANGTPCARPRSDRLDAGAHVLGTVQRVRSCRRGDRLRRRSGTQGVASPGLRPRQPRRGQARAVRRSGADLEHRHQLRLAPAGGRGRPGGAAHIQGSRGRAALDLAGALLFPLVGAVARPDRRRGSRQCPRPLDLRGGGRFRAALRPNRHLALQLVRL